MELGCRKWVKSGKAQNEEEQLWKVGEFMLEAEWVKKHEGDGVASPINWALFRGAK